jgi:hypothetical protein
MEVKRIMRTLARWEPIPVKGDPLDIVQQNKSRTDQELSKVVHVNAVILMLLEVDARLCQQIDRVLRVHVIPTVKHGSKIH